MKEIKGDRQKVRDEWSHRRWNSSILIKVKAVIVCELFDKTPFIPRSHSYCLSLPLCLEWYDGSITPRVHSGVIRRTECSYTTDRPRPLNKCVNPLSGVRQVRLTLTYPSPDSGLTYTYPFSRPLNFTRVCRRAKAHTVRQRTSTLMPCRTATYGILRTSLYIQIICRYSVNMAEVSIT